MSDRNKTHTSRITSYKNTGNGVTDLRRKRAELSITLRKQAREEQLLKRRALSPENSTPNEPSVDETLYTPTEVVQGLMSPDLAVRCLSARLGRRMLSKEQNPPITAMVEAGIVGPLVAALEQFDCPDLQFEAAWALTNIASGTRAHTMAVVEGGAIPKLIPLIERGGAGVVAEQAAWALGNIAGDGSETRDAVLRAGLLRVLLPHLHINTPPTQLRTNVWTYSNLCRNKNPMVKLETVSPGLPYLAKLLTIHDQEVLTDTCWALSYLTDGPNDRIETVQAEPHLTQRLVALLAHKAGSVKAPALRALGNMLTGSDVQTSRCIDAGCIPLVISLLQCEKPALQKEAAWAASNILAGTQPQIDQALESNLLPPLITLLSQGEPRCQKEAAWAITNLCLGGTMEQLNILFRAGFLKPYCHLLTSPDQRTALLVIEGLWNLLQTVDKYGDGHTEALCLTLEEAGVLEVLEQLQEHENEQIYQKVVQILDTYFSENNDENIDPVQTNNLPTKQGNEGAMQNDNNEYKFQVKQHNANFQF